ncbi:hypothetical protein TWF694_008166 [Orbilia ellipsospora]|uniref:Uncharacterized protein n=1 Tax=Orbilia ellipsospora TaxID=2528407 RepID=A0AAV9XGI8_9PEZI
MGNLRERSAAWKRGTELAYVSLIPGFIKDNANSITVVLGIGNTYQAMVSMAQNVVNSAVEAYEAQAKILAATVDISDNLASGIDLSKLVPSLWNDKHKDLVFIVFISYMGKTLSFNPFTGANSIKAAVGNFVFQWKNNQQPPPTATPTSTFADVSSVTPAAECLCSPITVTQYITTAYDPMGTAMARRNMLAAIDRKRVQANRIKRDSGPPNLQPPAHPLPQRQDVRRTPLW